MNRYEAIYESLQEQVNEGTLSVEDAEILNQMAFEKYNDDVTLEDAVVAIDELLTEAEKMSANERRLKALDDDTKKIYRAKADAADDAYKSNKNPFKKKSLKEAKRLADYDVKLLDEIIGEKGARRSSLKQVYKDYKKDPESVVRPNGENQDSNLSDMIKRSKRDKDLAEKRFNVKKPGYKAAGVAPEKPTKAEVASKFNYKFTEDTINELRLRTYEACNAGMITESERDEYLEYLNLENYQ